MRSLLVHFGVYLTGEDSSSCDHLVVRTLCCGHNSPGSNPIFFFFFCPFYNYKLLCLLHLQVFPGLSLMSEVLKKARGTIIPLSTLVTPLAPQLQIQHSSVAPDLLLRNSPSSQLHRKPLILAESQDSARQEMASSVCGSVSATCTSIWSKLQSSRDSLPTFHFSNVTQQEVCTCSSVLFFYNV